MDTYIVVAVTTNQKPTDPPAVTIFAVRAASEADAIAVMKAQVVAPAWTFEARNLGDGAADVLNLGNAQFRQL